MEGREKKVHLISICKLVVLIHPCRKYPTAENVEKKERLAADKSDRGESAITPLHRYMWYHYMHVLLLCVMYVRYIQHLVGDDRYSRGRKGGRGRGRGGRGRPSDRRDSHKQSFTPKQDSTNERQTHQEDASQAQQNIVGAILADCESQSAEHEVVNSPSPKKQRLEGPQSEKRASRRPKKRVKVQIWCWVFLHSHHGLSHCLPMHAGCYYRTEVCVLWQKTYTLREGIGVCAIGN